MKTSNQGYTDHHETILLRGLSLNLKLKMSPLSLLGRHHRTTRISLSRR